jgi:glycosyltransferase involved in cell wall biosynthesis
MKVLHVESGRHLYGGAKQVLYIMEGLQQAGVENLLACPDGAAIAPAAAHCARVIEMPMQGDADIGLTLRLRRLIAREKPDIVHLHSRRGADLWGGLAARLTHTPCVLSRRVDNPEPRWWVPAKYALFDHVITISEGIRSVLLACGVAADKVTCVRSAVEAAPYLIDYNKAAFRQQLGLAADTPLVAIVAQLIARKGHRYLLQALKTVLPDHPQMQLLIFGRGPLENELRQVIASDGLTPHVRLMGFVDNLPEILGCIDLLVHPADMEGLGVSLLQASAAEVPIVASRVGGIPEAVRDGLNGLLVTPGDIPALAAAIHHLLADPKLRQRMGEAGRRLVTNEFSTNTMCAGNLAIYRQVIIQRNLR